MLWKDYTSTRALLHLQNSTCFVCKLNTKCVSTPVHIVQAFLQNLTVCTHSLPTRPSAVGHSWECYVNREYVPMKDGSLVFGWIFFWHVWGWGGVWREQFSIVQHPNKDNASRFSAGQSGVRFLWESCFLYLKLF